MRVIRNSQMAAKSDVPEIFWSASDLARFLNVSRKTILEWVNEGRFENVFRCPGKTGEVRIPDSAYKSFLKMQTEVQ